MTRLVSCLALSSLWACAPPLADEQPESAGATPADAPVDGLTFEEVAVATGVFGVQRASAHRGGTLPALDADVDADTGALIAADGCDEESLQPISAGLSEDTVLLSGPIFDVGVEDGTPERVYRPVQLLMLGADGSCESLAALSDEQSMTFQNGFASLISGSLFSPTGMMMHLVESEDALWVFSNASNRWFSIDDSTGIVVEQEPFERTVSGAIADGDGGALVSLSGVVPTNGSTADPIPPQLLHLAPDGEQIAAALDLPVHPQLVGIGHYTDDRMGLMPGFVSLDMTLGPDGRLWVLHSPDSSLIAVSLDSGETEHFTLPIRYPTGIASLDHKIIVTGGLEANRYDGTLHQRPGLWTVRPHDGATRLAMLFSEPEGGWSLESGIVNPTEDEPSSKGVYLDRWLGLATLGTGQLLVTDPGYERVLLIE